MEPHIVKSYASQMERITASLEQMGALVCDAIAIAGEAVTKRDQALRDKAKANDKQINQLQDAIDLQIAEMFSKQSPMAAELRHILSAHKIANTLEKAGDLAKNTTKRLVRSDVILPEASQARIRRMVTVDAEMIREALAAFRARDEAAARAIWKRDDEADQLCRDAFAELLGHICATPEKVSGMVDLLFAVKQFERIADFACSIAKTVVYVTTGEKPRKDKDAS